MDNEMQTGACLADWQSTAQWLDDVLEHHRLYRRASLNLIASENVVSPDVERYYALALGHRYGNYEGLDVCNRKYRGNRFMAEMEARAIADACALFHARAADFRALSGHVAGSAAIMGLCEPDDLVLELDQAAGGHRLAEKLCAARLIRLRVEEVPFNGTEFQVDIEATLHKINKSRPRVVILGSSNYLFPTPLADIAAACHRTGGTLIMDSAHITGLIAGGVFPQPLDEGADLMVTSTHKTLAGPQGGLILARERETLERMLPALYPGLITNHHLMRIPAVIALFAEWRIFGQAYATAVVVNAIRLADSLESLGVPVVRTAAGATRSHTILIKTAPLGGDAGTLAQHLEECGIFSSAVKLPKEHGSEGIRIGVQEVTRMGLMADRIPEMAELIRDALNMQETEKIAARVKNFTGFLGSVGYCHSHA